MKYIKICPKCGSADLAINYPKISSTMMLGGKCRKCNFSGSMLEIQKNKIKEFRKKIKK